MKASSLHLVSSLLVGASLFAWSSVASAQAASDEETVTTPAPTTQPTTPPAGAPQAAAQPAGAATGARPPNAPQANTEDNDLDSTHIAGSPSNWYVPPEDQTYHRPPPPPPPPPPQQVELGVQLRTHIFAGGPVSGGAGEFSLHVDGGIVGGNLGILAVNGGLFTTSIDFLRKYNVTVYKSPDNLFVQVLFPVPEAGFVIGGDNIFFVPEVVLTGVRIVRCPFVAELRLPSIEPWIPLRDAGSFNGSHSVSVATGGGLTLGLVL